MNYYPTHILSILLKRKQLYHRLAYLLEEKAKEIEKFLLELVSKGKSDPGTAHQKFIPLLLEYGIISEKKASGKRRCTLEFVYALNFELTYKCMYTCSHCIQSNIRNEIKEELKTSDIKDAITRGYVAGLWQGGINFTGGEPIGCRSDLFEILDHVKTLKIPFRLNTNSWWAAKRNPQVCGKKFSSPSELIKFVSEKGLERFAFSYDRRYTSNPEYEEGLVNSIRLCEEEGVGYELVITGFGEADRWLHLEQLSRKCNLRTVDLIRKSSPMEMVDIGGAADDFEKCYGIQNNSCYCEKQRKRNGRIIKTYRGFARPDFLHVSPEGKVRTCLYAIGLANAGDLRKNNFTGIINNFPDTEHNEIFLDEKRMRELDERLIKPYQELYRPVHHQCTKNIILAKVYEKHVIDGKTDLAEVYKEVFEEINNSK